jgi:T4 RnlA family RNA ligase
MIANNYNSALVEYLNTNYPNFDIDNNADALAKDFKLNYGVNVKYEGARVLFKYDMIEAKWIHPMVRECRGHILTPTPEGWKFVSRPFDKFFNSGEGHSGVHTDEALNAILRKSTTSIVQKSDGSLIQVYLWDSEPQVSTSGTITPMTVQDCNFTFKDLFMRVLGDPSLLNFMSVEFNSKFTYMFELCASENRVLTKYPDDRLYLLGARDNTTGEYMPWPILDALAKAMKVHRPSFAFAVNDVFDHASLNTWVNAECAKADVYGEYAEGFIIYDGLVPLAKVKSANYLALHHLGGGDTAHSKNCLIDAFFSGGVDDIVPLLNKTLTEFLERLHAWYLKETQDIILVLNELAGKTFSTQKDFAMFVKDRGGQHQAFFFANKDALMAGRALDADSIPLYFKRSWSRFEKTIKAL